MTILIAIIGFLMPLLKILGLSFLQNTSFSIVSRSRNRNNLKFHLIAAFFSNTIWFLTFRLLVRGDMNLILFMPYCIGTMLGSVFGVKISMWVESKLGAAADGHLKNKLNADTIAEYFDYIDAYYDKMPGMLCMKFREWLAKKDTLCPACKINELDSHRGICHKCSQVGPE